MAKFVTAMEKCYFIIYHDIIFVTESTTSKNDLLKLGIKENKIVMNPPGVDQKLFHPAAKSKYPTMVYFAGMRRYKRPLEVLYLLKSLLEKCVSLKLIIIGTGSEELRMKKVVNELNLQNYVEFTGRIPSYELSVIVASSWLNVHTSVAEGWGYSILEASSAGTPTVAYDVPGVRDSVESGLNGIKVEDGNQMALADAAYFILTAPDKWWSSSIEVAQKYSWDKTVELWINLFDEVKSK
jgi:glycosyltransferase involved in cell wall biosynthesis